ncbi:MAG TPA: YbfB/YjiJ family MFS transporter [Alphaproteobacteria bacterium]|nr:YbfB/YjiJ family MFS transporter [Alphaproteobacteria bacterium]
MTRGTPVALALGGLVAMAAGLGIGRFVYTPILPAMVEQLDLTAGEAGLIASANFLGYLIGALLAVAPRLPGSRRGVLLGGLILSAVTTGGMGLVSSPATFLFLRFVGGVASAFVLVLASTVVLDRLAAAGRSGLSSLHFAGVGIGIVFSAVLVSAFPTLGAGWRSLWLASGAAALVAVVAVAWLVPAHRDRPSATTRPDRSRRVPGLVALAGAYGLFGFGYVITATFLVAIVRNSLEVRPLEPLIWAVVGLTAAPSVVLWTWAGARIGILRAFGAACLIEAVGVAASVLWLAAPGILIAAALLGGTFMGITALGLAAARELTPGDPRRMLALMTATFGFGQIVGPTFAGLLHDRTGSFVLSSLAAAGALVVAAILTAGMRVEDAGASRPHCRPGTDAGPA